MNIKELKEKINITFKSIEDVPQEYKKTAFGVILDYFLKNSTPISNPQSTPNTVTQTSSEPLVKLAQECNSNIEKIKNVLEFENNGFILLQPIQGETDKQKQNIACQIILTANIRSLNKEWTAASTLREFVRKNGLGDDGNLAINLKPNPNFRMKGSGKSMMYSLTTTGWRDGLQLIKKLAEPKK